MQFRVAEVQRAQMGLVPSHLRCFRRHSLQARSAGRLSYCREAARSLLGAMLSINAVWVEITFTAANPQGHRKSIDLRACKHALYQIVICTVGRPGKVCEEEPSTCIWRKRLSASSTRVKSPVLDVPRLFTTRSESFALIKIVSVRHLPFVKPLLYTK